MDTKDEEFIKRLQAMFKVEAEEHINVLSKGLIELEKNPNSIGTVELIESIFREMHSLKGAARSVGRSDIESLCQVLESIFAKFKNNRLSFSAYQFDLIHKAIDTISKMVTGVSIASSNEVRGLIKQLQSIGDANHSITKAVEPIATVKTPRAIKTAAEVPSSNSASQNEPVEEKLLQIESVRIPIAKLDPLFLQAEQMIQSKVTSAQRVVELGEMHDLINSWKVELVKTYSLHSASSPAQSKEIINWTTERMDELERHLSTIINELESDQRSLSRMVDEHVESMKKILMLPISTITEGFPKLVRDLARAQKKEVEFTIQGKEVEVDKRVLEELKDPLVHLIRNCIDHGIKTPSDRLKAKKTSFGTITLSFSAIEGHNLEISISDDGEGINTNRVISAAIKSGIITKASAETMSPQEVQDLVFKSGITTSPMITDISGRGLGLAIVREKVGKLGGTVSVDSHLNIGTTFRIRLPLTLSTSRAVLVRTGDHLFFMPTANVERAIRISKDEIKTTENRETILLGTAIIGIIKLGDVLGIRNTVNGSTRKSGADQSVSAIQIIVLKHDEKRIGFVVDEIFDELQILVKKLGKQLVKVRNMGGATILGNGKVVPIINVADLMQSATQISAPIKEPKEVVADAAKKYRILVVDDSITSRALIKSIVESAGYIVESAVDGVDAYTKVLVGEFDLVVSDVDMPRMNGFELTAKMRKEKKLAELPVVLVTALESREDRELGIDVGANAYIVKSSFDQSNLLEVIEKLI
ncbi:MAG TPA: hybrid sensor histidine kinase/response regulator [Williamwhitmania sp.]|nr:hybrid sensor histidine kinase/response regulator [Williamwhitmania sp.]